MPNPNQVDVFDAFDAFFPDSSCVPYAQYAGEILKTIRQFRQFVNDNDNPNPNDNLARALLACKARTITRDDE